MQIDISSRIISMLRGFRASTIVRGPNGAERRKKLPHDQWMVCLPDAHPGYIKWEDYLQNQKTLL